MDTLYFRVRSAYRNTCIEESPDARLRAADVIGREACAARDGSLLFLFAKSLYMFFAQVLVKFAAMPRAERRALHGAALAEAARTGLRLALLLASVGARHRSAPCAALLLHILERLGPLGWQEAAARLAELAVDLAQATKWPEPAGLPPSDAGGADERLGPFPLEAPLAVRDVQGARVCRGAWVGCCWLSPPTPPLPRLFQSSYACVQAPRGTRLAALQAQCTRLQGRLPADQGPAAAGRSFTRSLLTGAGGTLPAIVCAWLLCAADKACALARLASACVFRASCPEHARRKLQPAELCRACGPPWAALTRPKAC